MTFNAIAYRANFFCAILSALSSSLITSTIYNMKYYNIINVDIVSKVQIKVIIIETTTTTTTTT